MPHNDLILRPPSTPGNLGAEAKRCSYRAPATSSHKGPKFDSKSIKMNADSQQYLSNRRGMK
jgi:hypothetical protein